MSTAAPPRRSAAEQALLDDAITDLFDHRITFNQTLGMRVASVVPEATALHFDMRPDLVGHYLYGRLHGGVISAVLDSCGALALMVGIGEKHAHESAEQVMHRFARMGTIDLRVDYLRQGIGRQFTASAQVLRLGGRVGTTQMRLLNEGGELIATGAAAYMVA